MGVYDVRYLVDMYYDRFTEDEIKALESEDYEIRQCDECGRLMNDGFIIDDGREYYCSEDCLHKHYTEREYLCMYYDIECDKEIDALSDDEFDNLVEERGDDGNGWAFYTEWHEIGYDLLQKINKLKAEFEEDLPQLTNKVTLEGFVSYEPFVDKFSKELVFRFALIDKDIPSYRRVETICECNDGLAERFSHLKRGMKLMLSGRFISKGKYYEPRILVSDISIEEESDERNSEKD